MTTTKSMTKRKTTKTTTKRTTATKRMARATISRTATRTNAKTTMKRENSTKWKNDPRGHAHDSYVGPVPRGHHPGCGAAGAVQGATLSKARVRASASMNSVLLTP